MLRTHCSPQMMAFFDKERQLEEAAEQQDHPEDADQTFCHVETPAVFADLELQRGGHNARSSPFARTQD